MACDIIIVGDSVRIKYSAYEDNRIDFDMTGNEGIVTFHFRCTDRYEILLRHGNTIRLELCYIELYSTAGWQLLLFGDL